MLTIDAQLSEGNLSRFHLIYGEERFMVRHYKKEMIKALGHENDEMNCSRYEGKDISISEVIDVAQTLPFFAENRMILMEDTGFFKSANDLVDFLPELPDSTYIIFVEKDVDKRNRLYKYVQKNGCVTELKEEDSQSLILWIGGYLKNANRKISRNTANYLLQRVGSSMELLANELEKLIAYTEGRDSVEVEDINMICTAQITGKIFDLLDAVAVNNVKKALSLYHDLTELKEPPLRIFFMITRHISNIIQAMELNRKGQSSGEIAKKLGVQNFVASKYISQGNNIKEDNLKEMLNRCAQYDEMVKTGRIQDRMALELFIVKR